MSVNKEEPFTTHVRKATRSVHSISDALVNAKFAFALRYEKVWGNGLFVFYHVFAFLEDAKERLNRQDLNELFVNKILYRKKAFEDDLDHYLGPNWKSLPKPNAVDNYLEHLKGLERDNPQLLIVYVYHLYLGLLSGGQILAKKRRVFGNNTTDTTYTDKITDFKEVNISKLKDDFRQAMNHIASTMTQEEKDAFIEESNQVFLMNNLIVNSVGGQMEVIKTMLYKVSIVVAVCVGVALALKWKMKDIFVFSKDN